LWCLLPIDLQPKARLFNFKTFQLSGMDLIDEFLDLLECQHRSLLSLKADA